MLHINAQIADTLGKTKAQKNVIRSALQFGGTYNIDGLKLKGKMRELDAALQLARKYPERFAAVQLNMFHVIFKVV